MVDKSWTEQLTSSRAEAQPMGWYSSFNPLNLTILPLFHKKSAIQFLKSVRKQFHPPKTKCIT